MKRLMLVGGGHAHSIVLRSLASNRLRGVEVVVVSPKEQMIYTGTLPGWIAGHYSLNDVSVPLAPLVEAAGAVMVQRRVVGLDLPGRNVITAYGERIEFDILSIASGSTVDFDAIPGSRDHALPIRPLENFVEGWQRILRHALTLDAPLRLTVVGAGAGGVELTLAMQQRLDSVRDRVHLQLVTGDGPILPAHGAAARRLLTSELLRRNVRLIEGTVQHIEPGAAVLDSGVVLPSDALLLVTGPAPEPWPGQGGLATDERGFITVNRELQSTSHPFVFAAGDAATQVDVPRAKSGVYAVRAGPTLAANLRATMTGEKLRTYRPQRLALYLISTGGRKAVASYGPLAVGAEWVWRWKDRIDRAYIAQLQSAATVPSSGS